MFLTSNILSGGFTFKGTGAGNDSMNLESFTNSGSVAIDLGNGTNALFFKDGKVGGDFSVNGGNGADVIGLAQSGDITVSGGMGLTLGDGANSVAGLASSAIKVGKNLTYVGGSGTDGIVFNDFNTTLFVGGNLSASLKLAPVGNANGLGLATTFVGGSVIIIGDKANDGFLNTSTMTVGGNFVFTGSGGANRFQTIGLNVGGSVSITGEGGSDSVSIDGSTIHQNLTVTLGNDDFGGAPLLITQGLSMGQIAPNSIGGNLMITGGAQADPVTINNIRIGKNLTIKTLGGDDVVDLTGIVTNGSATIDLGADNNELNFNSGQVGGEWAVNGGNGADSIRLAQGDLTVSGGMGLTLGDGLNVVTGLSGAAIKVGKSVSYVGGSGTDLWIFTNFNTPITVGVNFTVNVKSAPVFSENTIVIDTAIVGGRVDFIGDNALDQFIIATSATVGGNLTFTGSGGSNGFKAVGLNVGGSVSITGGGGSDSIEIDGSTIHQNLTAMMGNDDGNGGQRGLPQQFKMGAISANVIGGSVSVTGGAQADPVTIQRTLIGKNLTLNTMDGIDIVALDDLDVMGITSINLGGGSDILDIDTAGALTQPTRFAGNFTVNGGAGDDTFNLSPFSGTVVRFGGSVRILGDIGTDTLQNFPNNTFLLLTNRFEDCEIGTF